METNLAEPSTRELRLFSELAYSNLLTEYYSQEGSKTLNQYESSLDKYHIEIDKNYPKTDNNELHYHFDRLFSHWKLVNTVQNMIKTTNFKENPLLDGFVFKSVFDDIFVIAFRGTNFKDVKQKKEDMIQNLTLYLADRDSNTQLGQAEVLVKTVIKGYLGMDPHQSSNSVEDLSKRIYITGHSKGGGLTQGVVCILREEFQIKVKGVTFSSTPIFLLSLQLKNPSMDWYCENYLLSSDRVLYGLSLLRFWRLRRLVKNRLKNSKIKYPIKKLRLPNLIKLWKLTKDLGSRYVGGIKRTFEPLPDRYNHSLWHYDKHFDHNGSLLVDSENR